VGVTHNRPFQFSFSSSLKVAFQRSRVTSDAGMLLVRELDECLGLSQLISDNLTDVVHGKNTQLPMPDLLRQSIYSRLAGYEDLNDAERLSQDPTFRLIGSEKIWNRWAALPSRLHWFETEVLTQENNLSGLAAMNREMIAKVEGMEWSWRAVLDMDSTEIPVYGEQEQSAYNGTLDHLLPPAAAVQGRGRLRSGETAAWQRAQRRRVGGTFVAGDQTTTAVGHGNLVSGVCRLRQARDLRGTGKAWSKVRRSASGQ
jgi:hypothetical protein